MRQFAFCGCSALAELQLPPDSVTKVADSAFRDCSSLRSVILPWSLREIGWSAFENTALVRVNCPPSVTKIGNFAFAGCPYLAHVTLCANTEVMPKTFDARTSVSKMPPRRQLLEGVQFVEAFHGLPW